MTGGSYVQVRAAWRLLRRKPGQPLCIAIALGLGVGATAAVFAAARKTVLQQMPFERPETLVAISQVREADGSVRTTVPPAIFRSLEPLRSVFENLAAYVSTTFSLTVGVRTQRLRGAVVSSEFFPTLAVRPLLGRWFRPAEDSPGSDRVAVLSAGLWQKMGGKSDVVGRPLSLNGLEFIVVGVMPPGFDFPPRSELWVPDPYRAGEQLHVGGNTTFYFDVIARLRPGASTSAADAAAEGAVAKRGEGCLGFGCVSGVRFVALNKEIYGDLGPALLLLFGAASLVLLIACVDVTILTLSHIREREYEFAVRCACGATRSHLAGQLLAEGLIVALVGAGLGALGAAWGSVWISRFLPPDLPHASPAGHDRLVIFFAVLLSVGALFVSSLIPALRSASAYPAAGLRWVGASVAGGPRPRRRWTVLVATQAALATILTSGALVMTGALIRLLGTDLGFKPESALKMTVDLPSWSYPDRRSRLVFIERAVAVLGRLPGMQVGAGDGVPLDRRGMGELTPFLVDETSPPSRRLQLATATMVTPGFLPSLGVPLLEGRDFLPSDQSESEPVAIVDDATARRFWPHDSAVGRDVCVEAGPNGPVWRRIIGVVPHVRAAIPEPRPLPQVYLPYSQAELPIESVSFVLRGSVPVASLASEARAGIRKVNGTLGVGDIEPMKRIADQAVARQRALRALLSALAALALSLAVFGAYGVISLWANRRQREFALRIALGGKQSEGPKLLLAWSARSAGAGVVTGLVGALLLLPLLAHVAYGVRPRDPTALLGGAVVPFIGMLLGACLPALRAARANPVEVLRSE